MWLRCNIFFDHSTGEMTFNDEHNLEWKPMTMMEILNNPYNFMLATLPVVFSAVSGQDLSEQDLKRLEIILNKNRCNDNIRNTHFDSIVFNTKQEGQ